MSKDRELQRLISIIHKTVVDADEGEEFFYLKKLSIAVIISSTADEEMGAEHEVNLSEETRNSRRKTYPRIISSATNSTWIKRESIPAIRGERSVNKNLNHATASMLGTFSRHYGQTSCATLIRY